MTPGLLSGKIALVTGAGSGIGRSVCRLFAREGAKVIVTDQNVKAAKDTAATLEGSEHMSAQMDVSSAENIKNVYNQLMKQYTLPPTIVVNAAGVIRDNFLLKLSEEDIDTVIDVNLKGPFLVTQCAAKAMLNSGVADSGSVINVSSVVAKAGNIGQSHYCAAKAGVELLTRAAAMELGQYGIRVNAIRPGFIDTPMTRDSPEKIKKMFLDKTSLGRVGQPEEVAELILFLASGKSSFVSGACIDVTGGL